MIDFLQINDNFAIFLFKFYKMTYGMHGTPLSIVLDWRLSFLFERVVYPSSIDTIKFQHTRQSAARVKTLALKISGLERVKAIRDIFYFCSRWFITESLYIINIKCCVVIVIGWTCINKSVDQTLERAFHRDGVLPNTNSFMDELEYH